MTAAEVTREVWSKPTWSLAEEFGITGTAIAKRCKKLGVPKPARGFWNKVTAGRLPHPNGVPVPGFSGNVKTTRRRQAPSLSAISHV